jgi:hypothetical protein
VLKARAISGEYIVPFQHIGKVRPDLNDEGLVTRVWEWMDKEGGKSV